MALFCGLFNTPGGRLLADWSSRIEHLEFSTNPHGFATLQGMIPETLAGSFAVYDLDGLPRIHIGYNGWTVWEGRLEDMTIVNGGVRIGALGAQRALSDVPYTALWSTGGYSEWRPMTIDDRANTRTEKFEADNNNRIFIAPKKNEVMASSTIGRMGYAALHGGERYLITVAFTYDVYLDAGYTASLVSCSGGLGGSATSEWSVNGNGASQTGTATVTLTNATADAVLFQVACPAATYAGETGDRYLKITSLRIKTTASAAVYADEIVKALAVFVNGINSTQLDSNPMLIESPALDLVDESYADLYPEEILNRLIALGDNQTEPRQWEWGVWEDRRLHLRPRGSAARAWYVDASAVQIERTLEMLTNSGYAVHQNGRNETQRTAVNADADSVTRFGLTRRSAVNAQTTSATQAAVMRDTALADGANPRPRSAIQFLALYDAAGARWPLWACRSGDTITMRNLPVTLGAEIDRIRTFTVSETRYTVEADRLEVTPESPLPRLEVMVARMGEGYR